MVVTLLLTFAAFCAGARKASIVILLAAAIFAFFATSALSGWRAGLINIIVLQIGYVIGLYAGKDRNQGQSGMSLLFVAKIEGLPTKRWRLLKKGLRHSASYAWRL